MCTEIKTSAKKKQTTLTRNAHKEDFIGNNLDQSVFLSYPQRLEFERSCIQYKSQRHGKYSSEDVTDSGSTSCLVKLVMPLDSSKEVLVKPSNIFFHYSTEGTCNTCQVLIVNKSARILRFKGKFRSLLRSYH